MNKKGGILGTLGFIFLILILLILIAVFYFYNFYIFKGFRTCVSSQEQDTNFSCTSNEECIEFVMNYSNISQEEIPQIIQAENTKILNEAIYCNNTCRVREIYGEFTGNPVESCNFGDKEFLLQLKGKDIIKMMDYLETKII